MQSSSLSWRRSLAANRRRRYHQGQGQARGRRCREGVSDDVDTRDKVVTLSGNVESEIAKTQASRLARETEGVARVVDNVTVTREPVDTPNMADRTDMTDPAITAAVKAKLLGDPLVAGLKIDVDTQSGVVTLSGTVKSAAEKEEAGRLARDTAGVKSVNDMIKVGA